MSLVIVGLAIMLLSIGLAYKNMKESSEYDPEMMRRHKIYLFGYHFGTFIIVAGIVTNIIKVLSGA